MLTPFKQISQFSLTLLRLLEILNCSIVCPQCQMKLVTILAAKDPKLSPLRSLQEGKERGSVFLRATLGALRILRLLQELLHPLLEVLCICFPHCLVWLVVAVAFRLMRMGIFAAAPAALHVQGHIQNSNVPASGHAEKRAVTTKKGNLNQFGIRFASNSYGGAKGSLYYICK